MIETMTPGKDLLEAVDTTNLPSTTAPFDVKGNFTEKSRDVRISTIWAEFRKRFCAITEEPQLAVSLRRYKLLKIAPDMPIIDALGGESRVETSIASVFAMIKGQAFGQAGPMQINGYANIFYVRDKDDVLCAVRVGWDGDGWVIDAIPVHDPLAWNGQHQIFCPVRDSADF
jgi:hypothetical protein